MFLPVSYTVGSAENMAATGQSAVRGEVCGPEATLHILGLELGFIAFTLVLEFGMKNTFLAYAGPHLVQSKER